LLPEGRPGDTGGKDQRFPRFRRSRANPRASLPLAGSNLAGSGFGGGGFVVCQPFRPANSSSPMPVQLLITLVNSFVHAANKRLVVTIA